MILCSAVVSSCNDEDDDKSGTFDGTIEGTLDPAIAAEIDEVVVCEDWDYSSDEHSSPSASATVKDGKFTLTLPTPAASELFKFPQDGVKVSPSDVKFSEYTFYSLKNGQKVGEYLSLNNESENLEVTFFYADKDVTISGSYTRKDRDGDGVEDENYTLTYTYNNLNLKKGWNVMIIEKPSENTLNITSGNIPSGLLWRDPALS